ERAPDVTVVSQIARAADEQRKLELEVSEAVANHALERTPNGARRSGLLRFFNAPGSNAPLRRRHLEQAAEEPAFGAAAQEHGPVGAQSPEDDAVPLWPYGFR